MSSIDDLETPALLLDVSTMRRNVDRMARFYATAGVRHRPHVKTTKCLEMTRIQRDAGVIGFTCQTSAELKLLLGDGATNLLWAQQPVGPSRVKLAVAANRDAQVICVVDSVAVAAPLAACAEASGMQIPVLLEIDTGQGRCGVTAQNAPDLAARVADLGGLRLIGVMTHEGHLSRGQPSMAELHERGLEAGVTLADTAIALRKEGHAIEVVSVGSTPGATSAPLVPGVTEARAGTYVLNDANQVSLGTCGLDACALSILATVVSNHGREHAIIDAGLKAVSGDPAVGAGGYGKVLGTRDLHFPEANEEHGFICGTGRSALSVGDRIRIVPNHACGTVNMWSCYWVVDGDRVVDRWPIAARY
jgi:D-serine deaminase-like pyridoxal phosphate-dependent protein